jgi:hypothetical protein
MNRLVSIPFASKVASCALVTTFALLGTACDDALTRVDLVANLRVLGARVEVEGDPDRASPAPGETASIRWLVADPRPDPALGWAFAICEAAPPGGNLPSCGADPFVTAAADVPVTGEPRIDFTVPSETVAQALAVFGVVCPDSEPTFDDGEFDCAGPGGRLVSLDFGLETATSSNRNPVLVPDALTLDGTSVPAGTDCLALPSVAAGSSHTLVLTLNETDRDAVEQLTSADPPKETLQVSHFTSAGALERAFTVFEASDKNLTAHVVWRAPKSPPPSGFVRLFFVVRDLRGGSDWIERAICVE